MSVARGQEALELDLFVDVAPDDVPTVVHRQPTPAVVPVEAEPVGTEPVDIGPVDIGPVEADPVEAPAVVPADVPAAVTPSRPAGSPRRPGSIALPPRPPVLSPLPAWLRTLRLSALPATLLGGAVGGLLVAREAAARPGLLALGLLLLVLGHALAGLVRDLGDARPGRAGPLRRREAGRATLVVATTAAIVVVALSVVHDARGALLLPVGALLLLLVVSRRAGVLLGALAGVLAGTLAAAVSAWAATGLATGSSLLAGLVVGAVLAGLLVPRRARVAGPAARLLVLLPYAAAGAAVWSAALPWPALAVALALPAARTASSAGSSAGATADRGADAGPVVAGHARLFAVLLVSALVVAAVTGTDLPLR